MENSLNQLDELIEARIDELTAKNKNRAERLHLEKHLERMESVMNQLSESDKAWLDNQLMDLGCLWEEDDKTLYKAGFCNALKVMKLLGV